MVSKLLCIASSLEGLFTRTAGSISGSEVHPEICISNKFLHGAGAGEGHTLTDTGRTDGPVAGIRFSCAE